MGTLEHEWTTEARLGPSAEGSTSVAQNAPSGITPSPLWEAQSGPSYLARLGYQPTTHADACLGYSDLGRQSAPAASENCAVVRSILARVARRSQALRAVGHGFANTDLAKRESGMLPLSFDAHSYRGASSVHPR